MTQTTAYTPTLMQKLLGKQYKWWYIVKYSFNQSNIKFVPFLILNVGSVLDFSITLYLWTLIEPTPNRITYFFVGFMFQRLIWSQFMMSFGSEITSGKITNRLLLPISNFNYWLCREIGSSALRNTISSILILSFTPFYFQYLQMPNLYFILSLPVLIVVAFFIDFCFSYIIGSYAFWNEDFRPLGYIFSILVKLLSGLAIPFSYFPIEWANILIFNPYSLITYHPMQIYLGKYTTNQIIMVFTGGLAWCVILYFLAKFVFKLGLKRNEAVGL